MRNIKLTIEYDGTNFSGWQSQINSRTVQDQLTRCISKVTGTEVKLNGAGRTDAGVHAKGQVANFYLQSTIPTSRIPLAVNSQLDQDISVVDAIEVPMDFHARYSAIGKSYYYQIYTGLHRSPLLRNYSHHVNKHLDINSMKEGAQLFVGTHDYKAFMSSGSNVVDTVRTIHKIDFKEENNLLTIYFQGNGFLYNMVRIMVGSLIEIGIGTRKISTLDTALREGNRKLAGATAPPQGLYLNKVFYPLTH